MKSATRETTLPAVNPAVFPPVTIGKLREHFRRTYLLKEHQVEIMVMSTSNSLQQVIASTRLGAAAEKGQVALVFHNLKGLLLNMGESEWATYARELENKLSAGEQVDYAAVIGVLEQGMAEVLSYNEEMASAASISNPGSAQMGDK